MSDFWAQSTELMLLGMGTVFVFLSLLVIGMMLMSAIINKLNLSDPSPNNTHANSKTEPDAEIAAVAVSAWVKAQTN